MISVHLVDGAGYECELEGPPSLEWLQKQVGGYIEVIYAGYYQLIVNADGGLLGMEHNTMYPELVGNVVKLTEHNMMT